MSYLFLPDSPHSSVDTMGLETISVPPSQALACNGVRPLSLRRDKGEGPSAKPSPDRQGSARGATKRPTARGRCPPTRPLSRGPVNRWGRWGRPLGMGAGHGLRAILKRENHFDRSAGHSIGFLRSDGERRFLDTRRATFRS